MEDESAKRINPFEKFKRKNQQSSAPIQVRAARAKALESNSFIPGLDDVQESLSADSVLVSSVNVDTSQPGVSKNTGLHTASAKQSRSTDRSDSSLYGREGSTGVDVRSHRLGGRSKKKPMPSDFSRINREAYLDRARNLMILISDYYGISESDQEDQIQKMLHYSNEELAHTVNGFEYACETVLILNSEVEARAIVLMEDSHLDDFFNKHTVLEEDLMPDEITTPGYKGSGQAGRGGSRRSFS